MDNKEEGLSHQNRLRQWDHDWNNWISAGMPKEDLMNPIPGPHPDKDH